jgi:hypothetical protein
VDTEHDSQKETCDRLVLLLASRPRDGWEDIYEEVSRREVERLAPHPQQEESPAAVQCKRGTDGNQTKETSANGILPE